MRRRAFCWHAAGDDRGDARRRAGVGASQPRRLRRQPARRSTSSETATLVRNGDDDHATRSTSATSARSACDVAGVTIAAARFPAAGRRRRDRQSSTRSRRRRRTPAQIAVAAVGRRSPTRSTSTPACDAERAGRRVTRRRCTTRGRPTPRRHQQDDRLRRHRPAHRRSTRPARSRAGQAPQNVTYTYVVTNTSQHRRCRSNQVGVDRRPVRRTRRPVPATTTATTCSTNGEAWTFTCTTLHQAPGVVHQHRDGLRRLSTVDGRAEVCSPPDDVDASTLTAAAAGRGPAGERARRQRVHAVDAERAAGPRRRADDDPRADAQRRRRHAGARSRCPAAASVSDRTNSNGVAILRVTAAAIGHGPDPGRRVLGGRAAVRPPGAPGRRPDECRGSPAERMLGRTVGAAAAILLAAAAPAQAAKIERLSRPGKTSYFAFVDRAEWARAKPSTSARTVAKLTLAHAGGRPTTSCWCSTARETRGRDVAARAAAGAAERHDRLGAGLGAQRAAAGRHVAADQHQDLPDHAGQERQDRLQRADRRRAAAVADAARAVLHPRQAHGLRRAGSVYGPLAFITSATSPTLTDWPGGGIVGIHGTNQPGLIPGRISHGCVRLRNADILRLAKLMPVGTPLTIT